MNNNTFVLTNHRVVRNDSGHQFTEKAFLYHNGEHIFVTDGGKCTRINEMEDFKIGDKICYCLIFANTDLVLMDAEADESIEVSFGIEDGIYLGKTDNTDFNNL